METANVQRRCHRCPDVGAFLEIYIHLTKYYSTEGSLICLFFLQEDISHLHIFMPRMSFIKKKKQ